MTGNSVPVMRFFCFYVRNRATLCDRFFIPGLSIMKGGKGGESVVVYADVLFLVNFIVDYLLLLLAARAAGAPLRRMRFVLGAAIGGLYAVMIFVPTFSFLNRWRYKGLSALLMLLMAYGATGTAVKQSLLFLGLTCALGGCVMAIGMMDATALSLGRGVVYSIPDMKLVLLAGAGCYVVLQKLMPNLYRHTAGEGELRPMGFELEGKSLVLTALLDTGNTLIDPTDGQNVPVAEGAALESLFPAGHCPTRPELSDPVSALKRLNTGVLTGRFRLLPYRAVGVERGFLLAVRMDRVRIGDRERTDALVALSPTPVSDGGGYRVLTGRW